MLRKTLAIVAVLVLAGMTASTFAGPITPGNIVLERFDGQGAAITANGTKVWLDEYTTGGVFIQSIAMPTVPGAYGSAFVNMGSSGAEGHVALSTNGQYLTLAGYDAALGTTTLSGRNWNPAYVTTGAPGIARVVGRVDMNGNVDTSTVMNGTMFGGAVRSAVMDGNNIWTSSSSFNAQYTTYGFVGASTTIGAGPFQNARVMGIYGGQLYASGSTGSGPVYGVATIGTGLPTTGGQLTPQLNGFPIVAGPSSYGFWFANSTTLYVADDRSVVNGGGAQKWTLSAGLWSLQYTLNTGLTSGLRDLTGVGSALYGVSSDNKFVTVTDAGAGSSFTTLVAAGQYQAFKGLAPTPEPGTLALLAIGGLALIRRRG